MGERSMKECVEEQLDWLREAIRLSSACGATVQGWYDEGANVEVLAECSDPNVYESAVYAWGYLNGCADDCDVTVMEYLDAIGLSFDDDDDGSVGSAMVTAPAPIPDAKFDRMFPGFDGTVDRIVAAGKKRKRKAKRPFARRSRRKKPRT